MLGRLIKGITLSPLALFLMCTAETGATESPLQLRIAPKATSLPELKISSGLTNYLNATCKLQNSTKAADNETANQLLQSAKMDLSSAAGDFYEASKNIKNDQKLSNTDSSQAKDSQAILKESGIEIPSSYVRLYSTLGDLMGSQASAIASIKYEGDDHQFNDTARAVMALTITAENNVSALQVLAGPPK
jgi:hypothetical protein